jgi:hypothetical protein
MPLELFPFRYFDPLRGKWLRARYVATRAEIAARFERWEIIGPPELRPDEPVRMFTGEPPAAPRASAPAFDPAPQLEPEVNTAERLLVCLFLRRYVTWCARKRRFAAMQGAAALHRTLCGEPAFPG